MDRTTRHLAINTRVQVGDDLATIRYIGPVEGSTGEWLGVEWDDDARGKHDGTHKGKSYFACRSSTSGSFIRDSPKKVLTGRSFLEALRAKYLANDAAPATLKDPLYLNGHSRVVIETVGFDEIEQQQSDLRSLSVVGLVSMQIALADDASDLAAANLQISDLDLSKNLINDWHTLGDIVQHLRHLRTLRLNAMRLAPLSREMTDCHRSSFSHLRTLVLCGTRITWDQVVALQPFVPQLEDLQLSGNQLATLTPLHHLPHLQCLNLEHNNLTDWHQVNALTTLPRLHTLFLNNNQLTSIELLPDTFREIVFLRVDHNQLTEWHHIDQLDALPQLNRLRCHDNPVSKGLPLEEAMAQVVGRVHGLTTLNGNTISPKERVDLERFYLKVCTRDGQTHDEIKKKHPRYSALCRVHGEPDLVTQGASKSGAALNQRLVSITLCSIPGVTAADLQQDNVLDRATKTVTKRVLVTMTVRSLRSIIQKLFGISAAQQELYVIQQGMVMDLNDELRDLKFYGIAQGDAVYILS
ncbi:hypothetical protein BC940DRAFT_350534 [Gongronella butleri]|nr:hypothetical protein BC940DRAFT_350534 [Gongronella butleri]